jgi:hypothetical protein
LFETSGDHSGCVKISERTLSENARAPSGILPTTIRAPKHQPESSQAVLTARGLEQEADVREDPLDMADTGNPNQASYRKLKVVQLEGQGLPEALSARGFQSCYERNDKLCPFAVSADWIPPLSTDFM